MPDSPQFIPPSSLLRYTEATRRALYDAAVALHFPPADQAEPGEWSPPYSPDDAGLMVVFQWDRWFATWEMVEERHNPALPPARKRELVRIQADPFSPTGLLFAEV